MNIGSVDREREVCDLRLYLVDVFLDYLRNSPYLRNLAGLTFRFVSSSVFDKLLNILMEVVKNSERKWNW